ncbi:glycosyltransferase family 2 protein [Wenyingzhuangia sp. IMCC45533]
MKNVVSVIVPCYNQEDYVIETLESVLNQTYRNWECIIINDGSTDNSEQIVKDFIKIDSRFKLFTIGNKGLSNARNIGVSKASGEYILPLDSDDKIHEEYLSLAVEEFIKDASTKLVYCNAELFDYESGFWELPVYSYNYLFYGNCIFCTAMYKRGDYFSQTSGYDVNMVYGYEDWEFWLQLLDKNSRVVKLEKILFYYRRHEISMSKTILQKDRSKWTYDYVYNKHFEKYMLIITDIIKKEFPYKHRATFLNGIKKANFDVYSLYIEHKKVIKRTPCLKIITRLKLLFKRMSL